MREEDGMSRARLLFVKCVFTATRHGVWTWRRLLGDAQPFA